METDTSTEEKIKNAARIVFHKKGFAATRTRDIAEEAGINLALLNYYFRSKEILFDIVMFETMQHFFKSIAVVVNNEQTSLATKIDVIVANYIDMLITNPNIPLFLLNELKMQPDELVKKMGMREVLMNSNFIKQFQQGVKDGKITPIHPLHFFVNIISITVFPFVASPIIKGLGDLSQQQFEALMQERKTLIPKWINASLKAK
ncbi:MAG: TetR/AcrR family transcriptional regulator [Chitinophagaceae bacterium]|nr:TetR/AcrR family transcriptional regulator [Chitinophagaceae bacterium]